MNHHTWGVAIFTAGIITGALWREAFELFRRKDELMNLGLLLKIHRTNLLMAALLVSMIFTGVVGVAVILNDNGRDELVKCVTRYNEMNGAARDARVAASVPVNAAELDNVKADLKYQRGLLASLQRGDSQTVTQLIATIQERIVANEKYLTTLEAQKKIQVGADYPPYDLCAAPQ